MSVRGMMRVVQFNWPMYSLAAVAIFLLLIVSTMLNRFALLRILVLTGALLTIFQTFASLVASHWVYDLSALSDWRFLKGLAGEGVKPSGQPGRIVVAHAGYDETHGKILELFPESEILFVDFYSDLGHREPSIVKARKLYPPAQKAVCFSIDDWPIEESSADMVLVAFAAHELRDNARREQFFRQARTTVASQGRIILVEHVRNLPNFVAFGIGAFHFYPSKMWRQAIAVANLSISNSFKITPLVEVLVLCR